MRRLAVFIAVSTLIFTLVYSNALAGSKLSGAKLKGVKEKKAGPSIGYLLRDDLKQQFKRIWEAYLAEDKQAYLSYFADNITIADNGIYGKKARTTKAVLGKRIEKEFKRQDFTQVEFDEAFDMNAPTMLFVMTEEQLHDSIPVWGFSVTPKEILPFMKPGDYLVIANTLPDVFEVVSLPGTVYIIFRKDGQKLIAVGRD